MCVCAAEKVSSLGKNWHRPCLRCERCSKTLAPGSHAEVSETNAPLMEMDGASSRQEEWRGKSSLFFFCCSTTDSRTATNRATPCCSGPKVWSQMLFEFSGGEQRGGGDGSKTTLSPNSRSTEGHFGALTIYQRQRWSVWIRPWWAKANNGCFCALHVSDWSSDKKESSAWREEGTVVTTLVKKHNPM